MFLRVVVLKVSKVRKRRRISERATERSRRGVGTEGSFETPELANSKANFPAFGAAARWVVRTDKEKLIWD